MFFRLAALVASVALIGTAQVAPVLARSDDGQSGANQLNRINHIVVIYQENHSFDNLFGNWGGVNGRADAAAAKTVQVNQAGTAFTCLKQVDVNLASPIPLTATCTDSTTASTFKSAFTNAPFSIGALIPPSATTCPMPGVFAANGIARGSGLPRRLHARHRPPLLPGAVPAEQRPDEPLHDRQRRGRPDAGLLRQHGAADLHLPAPGGSPLLRDRRRLLPGRLRRLLSQPPVADRGRLARLDRGAQRRVR